MILTGAEINSEIAASVAEKSLKESGALPPNATSSPENVVPVAAGSAAATDTGETRKLTA